MSGRKGLVPDANILLPAVFGQRVRQILEAHEESARFYAPDARFVEAEKYIPGFIVNYASTPCPNALRSLRLYPEYLFYRLANFISICVRLHRKFKWFVHAANLNYQFCIASLRTMRGDKDILPFFLCYPIHNLHYFGI